MARVIAIAGGSGSGKSTLASALLTALGPQSAQVLPLDAYYHDLAHLPPADRERVNFDHPDALDLSLFRQHLLALKAGQAVSCPAYDFATHCRLGEPMMVLPRAWIVVEGILVASDPVLRTLYEVLVFVEADPALRWQRRLARDQADRGRDAASVARFWKRAESTFEDFGAAARLHADCVVRGESPASESANSVLRHLQKYSGGTRR